MDMRSSKILRSAIGLVLTVGIVNGLSAASDEASDIFARRILPLAQADRPSSCRECHVAGIDLSQYIRSDPRLSAIGKTPAA